MELRLIETAKLCLSPLHMRRLGKSDRLHILPSIWPCGVLMALIVRPGEEAEGLQLWSDRRSYHVAHVRENGGEAQSLLSANLADGDNAAALKGSLIKNVALPHQDELTVPESFDRLAPAGCSLENILRTSRPVKVQEKRTLTLRSLPLRARPVLREQGIDQGTERHLLLTSKAQQRDWNEFFNRLKEATEATAERTKRRIVHEWPLGEQARTRAAGVGGAIDYLPLSRMRNWQWRQDRQPRRDSRPQASRRPGGRVAALPSGVEAHSPSYRLADFPAVGWHHDQ